MSWYRTYRPQRIADLHIVPVREAFTRILLSGEFSHAYLLAGPKGTGKTSAARILAKVLNCTQNKSTIEKILQKSIKYQVASSKGNTKDTSHQSLAMSHSLHEPCNQCPSCIAITNGSSLAVTEIDAASNRGIDDIRLLREKIGLAPGDGLISTYIIDEVHMLTTEAFNALLKVLEEPPAHVVFILATTDAQKMPLTVVSRCTLIQYRKGTTEELVNRLEEIAKIEKITVDIETLTRIAAAADGSFRDGVKVFEQLAAGKKNLSLEDIELLMGPGTGRLAADLLTGLLAGNTETILSTFQLIDSKGMDGIAFQKEVLTTAHAKLVAFAKENDPRFSKLVQLLSAIAIPIEPSVPIAWMPFELACLEYTMQGKGERGKGKEGEKSDASRRQRHSESRDAISTVQERIEKKESLGSTDQDISRSLDKRSEARGQEIHRSVDQEIKGSVDQVESKTIPRPPGITQAAQDDRKSEDDKDLPPIDLAAVQTQWTKILSKIREKSIPIEGLLRSTRLMGVDGHKLLIETSYQFHKDQLELTRNAKVIEAVCEEILGRSVRFKVTISSLAAKTLRLPDNNISGKVEDEVLVKAAQDAFL